MTERLIAVNCVLDPVARARLRDTLERLREAGLRDESLLEAIGVVSGRVAEERLDHLRRVPGVTVETDEAVRIPPPDAPIQ